MTSVVSRRRSRLPPRYDEWMEPFERRVSAVLTSNTHVLDVGGGRNPTIAKDRRPPGCTYVGLDVSRTELLTAPAGAYDEIWVADATKRVAELEGRFDLVVSWQVLEHVKPLVEAIENFRAYLRPGGHFVAQLSGTFSFFGLANRALPNRLIRKLAATLTSRDADTVFPAHYDHCWDSALSAMFRPWESAEITPRYIGAQYLRFLPPAQRLYLIYEESVMRLGKRNLATHYLIDAER